jgi:hypothetical protein
MFVTVTFRSLFLRHTYISNTQDEMGGTCSTYGRDGSAYKILVGKPEGKKPGWEN